MWRKIGEKSNAAAVARIKKQTSLLLAIRAECARAGVIVSDYYYAYQWEHRSQDQWEHRSHRAPVHLRTRASQRHTGAKKKLQPTANVARITLGFSTFRFGGVRPAPSQKAGF